MTVWYISIAVLVILVVSAMYNGLVAKRNVVRNAWSQIDVQLKRRHDLIPNLVETANRYMHHEREVFERVAQARAQAISAMNQRMLLQTTENTLTGVLAHLLVMVEGYPELKANKTMLLLQEELASTENRIAFARQFFNDSVADYNTARGKFPANVIAGSFGFHPEEFFRIELTVDRQVPHVNA